MRLSPSLTATSPEVPKTGPLHQLGLHLLFHIIASGALLFSSLKFHGLSAPLGSTFAILHDLNVLSGFPGVKDKNEAINCRNYKG